MFSVSFLGAGKVANKLAPLLENHGHSVHYVWSRDLKKAKRLAKTLYQAEIINIPEKLPKTDLIFLSVSDDAIEELTHRLPDYEDSVYIHLSGSKPLELLSDYCDHSAVFYIPVSFSEHSRIDFKQVDVFVEASGKASEMKIRSLSRKIFRNTYFIDSDQRKKLHLAAVLVNNFTNHFYKLASDILDEQGMKLQSLFPLIENSVSALLEGYHPKKLQTGPAMRGDDKVLKEHMKLLEEKPSIKDMYLKISSSIVQNT